MFTFRWHNMACLARGDAAHITTKRIECRSSHHHLTSEVDPIGRTTGTAFLIGKLDPFRSPDSTLQVTALAHLLRDAKCAAGVYYSQRAPVPPMMTTTNPSGRLTIMI
jgi:hypothetical protein